jgi:hypothetical protein
MEMEKSASGENAGKNDDPSVWQHDETLAKIFLNMTCIAGVCFWLNVKDVDGNEDGEKSGL